MGQLKFKSIAAAALFTLAGAAAQAQVHLQVVASRHADAPPHRVVVRPPHAAAEHRVVVAPQAERAWVPGHWEGRGRGRQWVEGHWIVTQPAYAFAPSHWHREHWQRTGRRDQDRDGVPDRVDRDRDGDDVANRYDRRPSDGYRY